MTGPTLAEPVERLRAAVVQVTDGAGRGGAGIAWRAGGFIVTSAHVVGNRRVQVVLPDGRAVPGEVVRHDPHRDLALVLAAGASLPPIRTVNPARLRSGTLVFAVGHPLGVRDAVSVGLLQATGVLPEGLEVPRVRGRLTWVQADLRLAPGNSGGPLADTEGRVLGVSAMIVAGLALAIPAPEVEAFVVEAGRASRGRGMLV